MMGPRVFEDLIAWQRARQLAARISEATSGPEFLRDFRLRSQLRCAAASVMSNVAEGFDRGGRNEFHQFLSIAKGSAAEVRSRIHFAFDAKMISTDQYGELVQPSREVARIIAGLRRAVAAQRDNRKRKG